MGTRPVVKACLYIFVCKDFAGRRQFWLFWALTRRAWLLTMCLRARSPRMAINHVFACDSVRKGENFGETALLKEVVRSVSVLVIRNAR